jgi:hypothetical protein
MRVLLAIGAIFAVVLLAPVLLVVAIALGPAALGIAGLTAATLFSVVRPESGDRIHPSPQRLAPPPATWSSSGPPLDDPHPDACTYRRIDTPPDFSAAEAVRRSV